jgi:antitoxin (DNA-binding transcriptional repressor) of toxin-antitoxin stability system
MGVMSIREFNANMSAAFAKVEAGEVIKVTRYGKVIANVVPERRNHMDDPKYRANHEKMMALLRKGLPGLKGPATYEERTER